jgi:hypothetical protein
MANQKIHTLAVESLLLKLEGLEELCKEAEEALALDIEGLIEDREEIPEPSALDATTLIGDYRDALAVLAVAMLNAA